jgi:hypothetical protein
MLVAANMTGHAAQRVLITGTQAGGLRFAARGLTRVGYTVETATTQGDLLGRAGTLLSTPPLTGMPPAAII